MLPRCQTGEIKRWCADWAWGEIQRPIDCNLGWCYLLVCNFFAVLGALTMAETLQLFDEEHNETIVEANVAGGVVRLSLDQLDYMADLMSELREMSQRSGLTTLAAILGLAQTEAAQQILKRRVA